MIPLSYAHVLPSETTPFSARLIILVSTSLTASTSLIRSCISDLSCMNSGNDSGGGTSADDLWRRVRVADDSSGVGSVDRRSWTDHDGGGSVNGFLIAARLSVENMTGELA